MNRDKSQSSYNWTSLILKLNPKYLNSLSYISKDWRYYEDLTVKRPVQREILLNEIVADFDDVPFKDIDRVTSYFISHNYKITIFASSDTGIHIHFFTQVKDKQLKFWILKALEKEIGVNIDAQVVKRGIIRAEDSLHPEKLTRKEFIYSNVSPFSYINELPPELIKKALDMKPKTVIKHHSNETPKCIRFILSNTFSDGRQRLVFVLSSWYIQQGKTKEDTFDLVKQWVQRQNYSLSDFKIRSTVNSSDGSMGCSGRHEILSEIGFDIVCN